MTATMTTTTQIPTLLSDPAGWPEEVRAIFERAMTCEFATVTKRGAPITYPVTPYVGEHGRTLDVSTGLAYPAKAERARRDPRVALLYSDPTGSGLADPPVVLVQGLATVRDGDLQANTDRSSRWRWRSCRPRTRACPGLCCAASAGTGPASGSR